MKNLALVLLLLFTATAFFTIYNAETKVITGSVVDESGNALIFANVKAKYLHLGTATDLEGGFSLTIPDTCTMLEVSCTGFTTQDVDIRGKDKVKIVLMYGVSLESVVVTDYKEHRVKQDVSTQGYIKTDAEIRNLPTKNINAIAGSTAGAAPISGDNVNIRGSRSNALHYIGDGVTINSGHQPTFPNVKRDEQYPAYHTEDYSLIQENKFQTPADAPLSTFSIDVDAASYANMRRYLNYGQRPPKDAVRIEEMVNYFDYEYAQPKGDDPFNIITEVAACPWNPKHKLVHVGLQGKEIPTAQLPPSNLVFLLDVSGSMNEENKLPLVIASFKILTEHLRAKDRVAIVVYAGSSGLVLPSTTGDKKADIIDALSKLRAGGSTAGAAGIRQAYNVARENFVKGGNNRVILATDGDFNVGVSSDAELVRIIEEERKSGVFLTVLGFGAGNYMDNKMQQLAQHGNGNHGYVDNITEARKVFVNEFGGTLFTIAKDVKIQVEFNPAYVGSYRLIGYENRMLAAEDFNDDLKDAGEIGSGHSVTALYEIIPAGVHSNFERPVDKLKYQTTNLMPVATKSDEIMTIKFRYKSPDGDVSKLIERTTMDTGTSFEMASHNFVWSAAVASFGMLLRDSEFAGTASFDDVVRWAKRAKGDDVHGYQAEFIRLVEGIGTVAEADK